MSRETAERRVAEVLAAPSPLEQRVAALEATVDRLMSPVVAPEWTEEQIAQFQRDFEAATVDGKHRPLQILPLQPNLLDPETVRQLLRESVTVVKPGEVLFFTVGDPNVTPGQLREIQEAISTWLEYNAPEVKAIVLPHGEFAAAGTRPGFMKDVRVDVYRHERVESVRLTHLPTGIVVDAATEDEAVAKLGAALVSGGDISINDARQALGLPEFEFPEAYVARAVPSA